MALDELPGRRSRQGEGVWRHDPEGERRLLRGQEAGALQQSLAPPPAGAVACVLEDPACQPLQV